MRSKINYRKVIETTCYWQVLERTNPLGLSSLFTLLCSDYLQTSIDDSKTLIRLNIHVCPSPHILEIFLWKLFHVSVLMSPVLTVSHTLVISVYGCCKRPSAPQSYFDFWFYDSYQIPWKIIYTVYIHSYVLNLSIGSCEPIFPWLATCLHWRWSRWGDAGYHLQVHGHPTSNAEEKINS